MKSVTELLPRKPKTASETFAAQNLVPLHHHAMHAWWKEGGRADGGEQIESHSTPRRPRNVYLLTIGKSASWPSAVWLIMPRMPNIAARPLLRSALSLNALTAGSSYRTHGVGRSCTTSPAPC